MDRGESSMIDKRRLRLLNAINFDWGYQRVSPKKQDILTKGQDYPVPYVPALTEKSFLTSEKLASHDAIARVSSIQLKCSGDRVHTYEISGKSVYSETKAVQRL